jgi:predicted transcriptional regulator
MKKLFAKDLLRRREDLGLSRELLARSVGVSASSIQNWENPEHNSFPRPSRWKAIKDSVGIDPREYKYPGDMIEMQVDRSVVKINAQDGAQVSVGHNYGVSQDVESGSHVVILNDTEYKTYSLYKKFGNVTILEQCLQNLVNIAKLSGQF